jgi:hypothetical protein
LTPERTIPRTRDALRRRKDGGDSDMGDKGPGSKSKDKKKKGAKDKKK